MIGAIISREHSLRRDTQQNFRVASCSSAEGILLPKGWLGQKESSEGMPSVLRTFGSEKTN